MKLSLANCLRENMSHNSTLPKNYIADPEFINRRSSNVEELSFTRADLNCNLRKRSINEFLTMFVKLQSFTYEPCDRLDFDRQYYKFGPDRICLSLLLNARYSLSHLKFMPAAGASILISRSRCCKTLTRLGKLE